LLWVYEYLRFDIPTTITTAVFWDVTPCSLIEIYRHFKGTCCLYHHSRRVHTEDAGRTFVRNICKPLPDYITSHSRTPQSMYEYLIHVRLLLLCGSELLFRWLNNHPSILKDLTVVTTNVIMIISLLKTGAK
jgi:hypothetical protein